VISAHTVNLPNEKDEIMLNQIKTAVGTMVITGMLVLPAWAQSPFPSPQPPSTGSGCPNVISEQEPNDLQTGQDVQQLSVLQSGACVAVSPASIDSGVNTTSPDFDFYVLGLSGVSQLNLQLQTDGQVPFGYAVFDPYTGQVVAECYEASCQAYVQTDIVLVGVMAADVAPYGLTITAAGGQQPFTSSSMDTFNLADMHDRVLNMR
jgi:hypothetical protein